jgi:tetratricopeptide (TPR) repeat protein
MRQFSEHYRPEPDQLHVQIRELLTGAIELHQNNRLPEAEKRYRRILQVEPQHAEALHLMGVIAYQQDRHQEALEMISKAIENEPLNPKFHNNLGLIFEALNQTSNAVQSYQQALHLDPVFADACNNLGNALKKEGRIDAAMGHFQKALDLEPQMPEAHLNLGITMAGKGDLEAATVHYQHAIDLRPDYEKAYNNLGNALREQGQIDAAIESFRQAVRIRPNYVGALNNLGNALRACDRLDEAFEIFAQAVKVAPDSAESYCNLGNAFKDSRQYEKALDNYKQAIQLRPGFAEAHFNCAMVHLLNENFTEGWREYEWRLQRKEWKTVCPKRANLPLWNGESFVGKKLLVYDEQGFGDTLQFVRYLPLVKSRGGGVIFETRRQLIGLFDNFPGVDELVERISYDKPASEADIYIPLCSLPGIFNTRFETIPANIPYVHPNPDKVDQWRDRISDGGLKVGLVWKGSNVDPNRSFDPALFFPLAKKEDIRLYGLQKGFQHSPANSEKMPAEMRILNLGDDLKDFSDTAGAIANLDLVISIDTSVAHLAGAMGKPVWVLLPYVADWRWFLERNDSPWYPTMRLFRQQTSGDWDAVIQRVTQELHTAVAAGKDMQEVNPAMHLAEDYYRRGNHYYDLNDLTRAAASYQKAIELKNDFFEAYFNLGKIYQDRQDPDTSISFYQNALQINPGAYQAYYNMGVVLFAAGRLDEAACAYRQAIEIKPDFPEAYNNLGVALQKQGKLGPAIKYFQKSVKLNPRDAEAYYNMGRAFLSQERLDGAEQSYRMALKQNPEYAEAHHNLGLVLHKQGKFDQAAICYRRTLQLTPDDANAYYNMGNIFLEQGNFEEMTRWYQKALSFTPDKAEAYNNLGKMLQDQGKIKAAETYFQEAIRSNPEFAEAHFNRSIALLLLGKTAEGWKEYEWRFKKSNWKNAYPYRFEQPRWDGTSFAGKKVLVHCEQGLGDAIQFARYLPMVKARGGMVIFEAPKPLMNIFDNFPGIDQLVEISSTKKTAIDFDFYVPLLSLPGVFQTTMETIPGMVPYIFADPHKKMAGQKIVEKGHFKVGIVWAGGILHKKDSSRSCSLKQFLPLTRIADVLLYGLQKGPASQEVEEFSDQIHIENFGEKFEDFTDTAGLIENLDLVISVDTAVAHLAGAMGKPVWVLLPFTPDWRWMLNREESPWYPTMRLFRQKKRGCWDEVLQCVATELSQWVHQRTAGQNWIEENYK